LGQCVHRQLNACWLRELWKALLFLKSVS
jgi:hypothetical protein